MKAWLVALFAVPALAAPKGSGEYISEAMTRHLEADIATVHDLEFEEAIIFRGDQVELHFTMETEKHRFRLKKGGLELLQADGETWAARTWKELPDGAVETDVMREGEPYRYRWNAKGRDALSKEWTQSFTRTQLARLEGRYGTGDSAVEVKKTGLVLGGKAVAVNAAVCIRDCSDAYSSLCLVPTNDAEKWVLVETPDGLLRAKPPPGLCPEGYAVDTEGAVPLQRQHQAVWTTTKLEQAVVEKRVLALAPQFNFCSLNPMAWTAVIDLSFGAGGLVERAEVNGASSSKEMECLRSMVVRLVMPSRPAFSPSQAVQVRVPVAGK